MKRLLEWVLEQYDAGYTSSEIARATLGYLTKEQVDQILLDYYEEYTE